MRPFVLLLALLLAACAAERDIAQCKEFGFKEGTESFAQCRLEMRAQRIQAYQASQAAQQNAINIQRLMKPVQ